MRCDRVTRTEIELRKTEALASELAQLLRNAEDRRKRAIGEELLARQALLEAKESAEKFRGERDAMASQRDAVAAQRDALVVDRDRIKCELCDALRTLTYPL